MTVHSNYAIAIASLSDWLKNLAPVFQLMRSKTKTNRITRDFSRALSYRESLRIVIGSSHCLLLFWLKGDNYLNTGLSTV